MTDNIVFAAGTSEQDLTEEMIAEVLAFAEEIKKPHTEKA